MKNNYNKFSNTRSSTNRSQEKVFITNEEKRDSGKPENPRVNGSSTLLVEKSFKELKFGSSVEVKADPESRATSFSDPYAIIASTNKIVDANYPGKNNLAGNQVTSMLNSNTSKLVNNLDSGSIDLKLNYLYLSIQDQDRANYNQLVGNTIDEALAATNATMFTQLDFAKYYVEDADPNNAMPSMDAKNLGKVLVLYQTVLQNLSSCIGKYTQLMSLEDELIDMGYLRESSITISLFGLLHKAAFVSQLDALAENIVGEYFDQEWYQQVNVLSLVPSRKSKCVRQPLITATTTHYVPNIIIYQDPSKSVKILETSQLRANMKLSFDTAAKDYSVMELTSVCQRLLDQASILQFARSKFSGINTKTVQSYFNDLVLCFSAWQTIISQFKLAFTEIRSYLDVATRVGLNTWKKGTSLNPRAYSKISAPFNQILHNVMSNYLSCPDEITWNPGTVRWVFWSFWDEYTGIPKFDLVNGGAFITFSQRTLVLGNDMPNSALYVPKLFDVIPNSVYFVSRTGYQVNFAYEVKEASDIKNNPILSRLMVFESNNAKMRIPLVDIQSQEVSKIPQLASAAYELMQTMFGYGMIKFRDNNTEVTNFALSRDYVSIVDVQMEDVSNAMITYARTRSPFKVWTISGAKTMGFGSN